jgi:hypothetical protein
VGPKNQIHSRVGLKLYSLIPTRFLDLAAEFTVPHGQLLARKSLNNQARPFLRMVHSQRVCLPSGRSRGSRTRQDGTSRANWMIHLQLLLRIGCSRTTSNKTKRRSACHAYLSTPPTVPSHSKLVLPSQKSAADKAVRLGSCYAS